MGMERKMTIANSLEVLGFLQLLAAYDLHSAFDPDEVMSLVESVAHDQRTTKLCHQLKFADRIPGLIQNLLRNFQCLEAVRFIYSFDKADYFPPVPILKSYLEHVEKTADASLKECNSQKAREEAIDLQVAAMGAVIRCIMDHNLESEYSTKILQERVDQLQELKMILKSRLEDNKKRPPKDDAAKSEPVKRHCGNVLLLHKHADHHPSNSLEPLPQHQSGSHTKEYSPSSKAPFRHYSLGGPAPTIQHVDQLPFHYVSNTARNRKSTHSGLPSHQIGMVSNYLPRSILPEAGNFYP